MRRDMGDTGRMYEPSWYGVNEEVHVVIESVSEEGIFIGVPILQLLFACGSPSTWEGGAGRWRRQN